MKKQLNKIHKMFRFLALYFFFTISSVFSQSTKDLIELNQLIDTWHTSAAKADFKHYFKATTEDFVFLGTAPGERWNRMEFQAFCKPYFDKGKAWDFQPSERHWQFAANGKVAYFDENLATWMESCRGSGICVRVKGEWKISYYNLTVLIENEKIKEFIKLRKE